METCRRSAIAVLEEGCSLAATTSSRAGIFGRSMSGSVASVDRSARCRFAWTVSEDASKTAGRDTAARAVAATAATTAVTPTVRRVFTAVPHCGTRAGGWQVRSSSGWAEPRCGMVT
ncbi:hypothetical protein ACFFX0_17965 [Citricoccus parietis]|uniref:Uncharacterized protein n=1 Tax=Citricoccus parietis TaxID=592307 RepID=A0ABV5G234_9MICC